MGWGDTFYLQSHFRERRCAEGRGWGKSVLEAAPLFEKHLPIEPLSSKASWHPDFICIGQVSKAKEDTVDKQPKAEDCYIFRNFQGFGRNIRKWKREIKSFQPMDKKSKPVGMMWFLSLSAPPFIHPLLCFLFCFFLPMCVTIIRTAVAAKQG